MNITRSFHHWFLILLVCIFGMNAKAISQDSGLVYNFRFTYSSMTYHPVLNTPQNVRGADSGYIVLGPEETFLVSDTIYDGATGEPELSTREVRVRGYATIYIYATRGSAGWQRQFQVFFSPPKQEIEEGEYWVSGDWAYHDVVQTDAAGRRLTAVLSPNRGNPPFTGSASLGRVNRSFPPMFFSRALSSSYSEIWVADEPGTPALAQPVRGIQSSNSSILTINPVLSSSIAGLDMEAAMDLIISGLSSRGYEEQ
jgi:hypothetical protein